MRVLLLAPMPPDCGGIANWSKMICLCAENDCEVDLIPFNVGSNKVSTINRNFVQRVAYGLQDLKDVLRFVKRVIKNVDIIHFTTTGSLSVYRDYRIIRIANKYKVPIVMHIRVGRMPLILEKNNYESFVFKKNFKNVDKIIAIDRNTFNAIKKFYPQKLVEIINPIDTHKVDNILTIEHKNNNVLCFVGWVIKEKGIEELILAFNSLKKKYTNLFLKIVGPYNNDYMEFLQKTYCLNDVVFLGEKDNFESLKEIKESEIFVFPSYSEGCPNVILEAMLCKTPIIASSVGAIPELLSSNCGILVNKNDVDDLTLKIDYLLSNVVEQKTLAANAYDRIKKEMDIDVVYKKYKNIWRMIVDENS